jgi:hypothetical protein
VIIPTLDNLAMLGYFSSDARLYLFS